MSHPITELQTTLVTALLADSALTTALGGTKVFDAPRKNLAPPYVVIARHDVLPRDGDLTPGHDHRLLINCWHNAPSREDVLVLADRIVAVALSADLDSAELIVTHAQHDRTETAIDPQTGQSRAAIALRFFSEPI